MTEYDLRPGDKARLQVTAKRSLIVTAEGWSLHVESTDGIVTTKTGDSNREGLTICCGGAVEDDET